MSGALTGGVGGTSPVILTSVSTVPHSILRAATELRVKMSISPPCGISVFFEVVSGGGTIPPSADGSGGGGRAGTWSPAPEALL